MEEICVKKKLVSLVLVVALLVSIPLSAFASVNFNSSILNGRDDIIVSTDDMAGITYIRPAAVADGTMLVQPAPSTTILVFPNIGLTDSGDFFTLQFGYHGLVIMAMNGHFSILSLLKLEIIGTFFLIVLPLLQ